MKQFIDDFTNVNYPLADGQDIGALKVALQDMAIVSSYPVVLNTFWKSGDSMGGTLSIVPPEDSSSSDNVPEPAHCLYFDTVKNERIIRVKGEDGEPYGWIFINEDFTQNVNITGAFRVNPCCLTPEPVKKTLSINGHVNQYPAVLNLSFLDYITYENGTVNRSAYGNSQELDSRNWDESGPLLSINGVTTQDDNINVSFRGLYAVVSYPVGEDSDSSSSRSYSGPRRTMMLFSHSGTFICPNADAMRDRTILSHEDYGLVKSLPLDNMVKVWRGELDRRAPGSYDDPSTSESSVSHSTSGVTDDLQ